ncbi:hypothetical protein ACTQ45_01690 [Fundicoccus sp. Sow4_D5]|uniref:hypothetical protein n=1 Tax=unclassified Fundicoccus TaxID=2761543 RepID=UPI003F903704
MTEKREMMATLAVIESTIAGCVKVMPKFTEGSSQHTLLTNRIKALEIAQSLLHDKPNSPVYSKEELQAAQAPIHSLIHKSEKAMRKFKPGHPAYTRLNKLIQAMTLSDLAIEEAIENRVTRVFRHL